MTVLDVLLSRVSVSSLQEPTPEGRDLDLILASGLRAPDHGGLRPWRFVLVRGAAREAFADTIIEALKLEETAAPRSLIARHRARLLNAPLIIALGVRLQPGTPIPEIEQMLSAGAAAMNMLNAAHALGYGGIWITGAMTYDPAVLGVLGLEASDKLAGFLFVGTPKEMSRTVRRPDVSNHVTEWTDKGTVSPFAESAPA
jgi:nitroreductase